MARAGDAYQRVIAAQSALARADWTSSEAAFTEAGGQLKEAGRQLDEALQHSRWLLTGLDFTGRLRVGSAVLDAGEAVSTAGAALARALAQLNASPGHSLVDRIHASRPHLFSAATALGEADQRLSLVEGGQVPAPMRERVAALKELVPVAYAGLDGYLKRIGLLLTALGHDRGRVYLLLFQNNAEIRPTGGFIGSLAVVHLDRGVAESVTVHSVYDPDGQLKEFIAPPDILLPITDRWYLRDSNWFLDYRVSALKAAEVFEKEGGPTVDGVVALTPAVIRSLLKVTGPLLIPSFGVTVTADDFVAITQEHVTYAYDRERNQPKEFLAAVAAQLINRLGALDAEQTGAVVQALSHALTEKSLLLYFRDPDLQAQVENVRAHGGLPSGQRALLMVNNANIGGHKSDQFIEQEIDYRVTINPAGEAEAVVTVRRTHRGPVEGQGGDFPPGGEDPARKDNIIWQRTVVPAGSVLLSASGFADAAAVPHVSIPFTDQPLVVDREVAEWQRQQARAADGTVVGHEAGYQYFGNWVITRPGETTVTLYRYRLPEAVDMPTRFDPASALTLYIAKQPGAERTALRAALEWPPALTVVTAIPAAGVTQTDNTTVVYEAPLTHDVAFGAVVAPAS